MDGGELAEIYIRVDWEDGEGVGGEGGTFGDVGGWEEEGEGEGWRGEEGGEWEMRGILCERMCEVNGHSDGVCGESRRWY